MVYAYFAIGIAIVSLVIPVLRFVLKSKLEKFKKFDVYKHIYSDMMLLTVAGLLTILALFKVYSQPIYEKRDECCKWKIRDIEKDIFGTLNNAKSSLTLDLSQKFKDIRTSTTSMFTTPLFKIGGVIKESIHLQNYTNQNEEYMNHFIRLSSTAPEFEILIEKVKNLAGIKQECIEKITKNEQLFKTVTIIDKMYSLISTIGSQLSGIGTKLGAVGNDPGYKNNSKKQAEKTQDSTKYIETNIDSLRNRVIQSSNRVSQSVSTPENKSEDSNWVDILYNILYGTGLLMILCCGLFTLFALLFKRYFNKYPSLLNWNYIIGVVFLVLIVVVPAVLFSVVSISGTLETFDICSQRAKNALLSNYTIEMMDGDSVMVKKSFERTCKSPNNKFFTGLEIRKIFSTDVVVRILDLEDYKTQLVTSIYNDKLPRIEIPAQFKEEIANISSLVGTLDELLELKCIGDDEKQKIEDYRKEYKDLVDNSSKYEQLVEDFGKGITSSKEVAFKFFDESFEPVRSEFENLLKGVIEKIESADFSCKPFVDSDDTCSKSVELDNLGIFFCVMLVACLILICWFSLPSPWSWKKKNPKRPTDAPKAKKKRLSKKQKDDLLNQVSLHMQRTDIPPPPNDNPPAQNADAGPSNPAPPPPPNGSNNDATASSGASTSNASIVAANRPPTSNGNINGGTASSGASTSNASIGAANRPATPNGNINGGTASSGASTSNASIGAANRPATPNGNNNGGTASSGAEESREEPSVDGEVPPDRRIANEQKPRVTQVPIP